MKSVVSLLVSSGLLAAALTVPISAPVWAADGSNAVARSSLPEPFSEWNVELSPVEDNPQVLNLRFDSPLLDRRVTNRVYVPDSYSLRGGSTPVMYYLHGTVFAGLDNHALDPITDQELLLDAISAGGGYTQTELFDFDSQLSTTNFMVVAPDNDPNDTWCETCTWIDGADDLAPNLHPVTAETIPADSHLHEELYPLVEALFNVRTDRAGRGVMGFSMGGWGTFLQGMRHPDKYAFVAPVSGVYEILDDTPLRTLLDTGGWLRDQGYSTSVTNEIWWRNFNPADIASNLDGTGTHLMFSFGDGCVPAPDESEDCEEYPTARHPAAALIEEMVEANNNRAIRDLPKHGIEADAIQLPGVHGANNHRVYSDHIVPAANAVFANPTSPAERVTYRTVDSQFDVWGYSLSVQRGNDEFLTLDGARLDGRAFTINGTGLVDVITPVTFTPGQRYTAIVTSRSGKRTEQAVVADADGRVRLKIGMQHANAIDEGFLGNALIMSADRISVSIR